VQFIYLFDHKSTDDTESVVEPYINRNVLQRIEIDFEYPEIQTFVFKSFLKQTCNYRWIMFIDVDEFVYHKEGQNLLDFLKKYSNETNLIFQWRNFVTSGFIRPPKGKVIENYRYSFIPKNAEIEFYTRIMGDLFKYKSIVNPAKILEPGIHMSITVETEVDVSTDIFCNHYITKSKYEFLKKLSKIPRPKKLIPHHRLRRIKMLRILDKYASISNEIEIAK
jgi:hypothetical protein